MNKKLIYIYYLFTSSVEIHRVIHKPKHHSYFDKPSTCATKMANNQIRKIQVRNFFIITNILNQPGMHQIRKKPANKQNNNQIY